MQKNPVDIDCSKPPHWAEHGVAYFEFHGVDNLPDAAGEKVVMDLRDVDRLDPDEVHALQKLDSRTQALVLLHAGEDVREQLGHASLLMASNCDEALGLFGEL